MSLVQVRGVSPAAHRSLKARAALRGMSLSEFLRIELERIAERPTPAEMRDRLTHRAPVEGGETGAESVRALRDELG